MDTSREARHPIEPINAAALAYARQAVPTEVILERVVAVFRALADPTRARILYALTRGPFPT